MGDDTHLSLENPTIDFQAQTILSARSKNVEWGLAFMAYRMLQSCSYSHRFKKL